MIKLIIIILTALVLGGCTLLPNSEEAAKDQASDSNYVASPTPSLSTDDSDATLESDLNATVIEEEDFSDLE